MRRDFRVKLDISQIYQDPRHRSWVFVDGSRIFQVRHLAEHIQELFNIESTFYLLAYYEDAYWYLPFDEDVRVLENNDIVRIVLGTDVQNEVRPKGENSLAVKKQYNCVEPEKSRSKENLHSTVENSTNEDTIGSTSRFTITSFATQDNAEVSDVNVSANGTLYKTALHEVEGNNTGSRINGDDCSMDTTLDNPSITNKRKRIRKRKNKKSAVILPESDTSLVESSGKKPKIVNNVLISTGKHIRFQGVDEEDSSSDNSVSKEDNTQNLTENGKPTFKTNDKLDLSNLLTFRQSSTPLTFSYKKIKKDDKPEKVNESDMVVETSGSANRSHLNISTNQSVSSQKNDVAKENSCVKDSIIKENDTIVFKTFKIDENYTPQLSQMIVAKVLHLNEQSYTLDILHNKEELKEPEGKFSLPKEDDSNIEEKSICVVNKADLYEVRKLSLF